MAEPDISVCILAGHGTDVLERCLKSLRGQIAAPPFELLIGGQPTRETLEVVQRNFPQATVHETRGLPGAARNPLIERARGALLLFLDDDITAPPDLLGNLAGTAARYPEAVVFGGPNGTPPHSSRFQAVQGAVLSSVVGSGPVRRRYGSRRAGFADERWFTLCNIAIRAEAMVPFFDDLVCAEENALLATLRAGGARMRYEPRLRVFHERRPTERSFARQMFKYGRGRGQLTLRDPRTLRAAYLAPSGLLLYLLLTPILATTSPLGVLALIPLALYGLLVAATAARIAWTLRRLGDVPMAGVLVVTVHLFYAAGVMWGMLPSRSPHPEASAAAAVPPTASLPPTVDPLR
jgi:succinoglycan biosynthesis protein ExoA